MVIVLMGVAGSGKTTVGQLLASQLGWTFRDADDFHPPENVAKMSSGIPLTDRDRAPWLAAIRAHLAEKLARGEGAIVTCSALKERYRAVLRGDTPGVQFVHLTGTPELLAARIGARQGHFMKPEMLPSQLAALEPPIDALAVDIAPPPDEIVAHIRRQLALP